MLMTSGKLVEFTFPGKDKVSYKNAEIKSKCKF